jgi:hypothetical protein
MVFSWLWVFGEVDIWFCGCFGYVPCFASRMGYMGVQLVVDSGVSMAKWWCVLDRLCVVILDGAPACSSDLECVVDRLDFGYLV